LGYDRAIVTAKAGTTRDTIEERIRIGGTLIRISDTAGIRETDDEAEMLGVERAKSAASASSLVLAVFDGAECAADEDRDVISRALTAEKRIAVLNKADLPAKFDTSLLAGFDEICVISAKNGDGMDALSDAIKRVVGGAHTVAHGEILTNSRQAEAVGRALEYVAAAHEAAVSGVTPDAVLTEIEGAMAALGELTGKTVRDDVVQRIFERFCVGK
ncbi:MAG: GTP-binding protein, partial [Oscillospiraceae bacterium]|nr:GTP-binding protein [Oscillospiraceae bacterium]